jgi:glycosyltransferase involved in cell wall biosynthesis
MQSCDVLVIPLPYSLFSSVYTSPLKMFEYMASGVPIVASDLPALREIINEKNALFARAGDEADLARALSVIFNDPLSASTRARQAHHDVRAYTWHNRALDIAGHMRIIQ